MNVKMLDRLSDLDQAAGMDSVYIYGAGTLAGRCFLYLKERCSNVKGFVMSDLKSNPRTLWGLPVSLMEDICFGGGEWMRASGSAPQVH